MTMIKFKATRWSENLSGDIGKMEVDVLVNVSSIHAVAPSTRAEGKTEVVTDCDTFTTKADVVALLKRAGCEFISAENA